MFFKVKLKKSSDLLVYFPPIKKFASLRALLLSFVSNKFF